MNLKLQGKTAFITGSTSGIGWATARAFAQEGVHVILNGRRAVGGVNGCGETPKRI
jgi:NAD(P)-dependent dehydrogenase (short-subunit alcohol dehydrogenase family)